MTEKQAPSGESAAPAQAPSIGQALRSGVAKRIETTVGGGGGKASSSTRYGSLQEMLEVAGVAAGTVYWNRAQKSPGAWRFGELVLAPLLASSQATTSGFTRVATGVFTGALVDIITGGGSTAGISSANPIKEIENW